MGLGSRPTSDEGTQLLFSEATSVIGALCAIVFSTLGILGNLFTIIALVISDLRGHPTTFCVISLAFSDLLFSSFVLPLMAHRFLNRGCEFMCLDIQLCHYYPFFLFGNIGVSLYIMVLIALQRLYGVFYGHLLPHVFNKRNVVMMLIVIWLISFGSM